jgi:hypothetical protein
MTATHRAYAAVGCTAEGIAGGNAFFGDVNRHELVMGIPRPQLRGPDLPAV